MNCRREWSKEFMIQSFPGTFINQTYKKHRENILMARQRSVLPLRVVKVERMNRGEAMTAQIKPLHELIEKKRSALLKLEREYYIQIAAQSTLMRGEEPRIGSDGLTQKKTHVIEFHKPCPADACRGFLSTQYKCGICSIWVCPDCYEIKGLDKDVEHTCKPENVETVKLKKKQCKNCPECGAEIYKESGCAQMWCTQCKTTFDWATGAKLVNVKVHNPHYYEYLRRTQGAVPRDVDDGAGGGGAGGAGGACYNHHETYIAILQIGQRPIWGDITSKNLVQYGMSEVMRTIAHIDDIEVRRHNTDVNESTNEDIDIDYLRKQIDEKFWKQKLQNREKQRIKKQDILQILQMVSQAGKDIILGFVNRYILDIRGKDVTHSNMQAYLNTLVGTTWKQLEGLRVLCNESFEKHARLYKCQAPKITLENISSSKYKTPIVWNFRLKYNYLTGGSDATDAAAAATPVN
jgi:hypothetical protein